MKFTAGAAQRKGCWSSSQLAPFSQLCRSTFP